MNIKILLPALLVGTCTTVAIANPPKPEACPSVTAIIAAGLSGAEKDQGQWIVTQKSDYGTSAQWEFGLAYFSENTSEEAIVKARTVLETLDFLDGPKEIENLGWACLYTTDYNVYGMAGTPPRSSKQFYRLLKR